MVSKYIAESGVFLGDDLLGANQSNPYGHYEDREVMDIHNKILLDSGTNWRVDHRLVPRVADATFSAMSRFVERRHIAHPIWGFKDPRVCHFLPIWKSVAPDAKTLVVFRNPIACTNSLYKRHGYDTARDPRKKVVDFYRKPDLALKIWIVSNEALADFAEANPESTLVVSHQAVIDGFPVTAEINRRWDFELGAESIDSVRDEVLGRSFDKALRVSDAGVAARAREVWNRLLKLEDITVTSSGHDKTAHPELRFVPQQDVGQLLMEAELLRFENEFLRNARVASGTADNSTELRKRLKSAKRELEAARQEVDTMRRDLAYLLGKARKAPYNFFFGRKRGVRQLSEKYGLRD